MTNDFDLTLDCGTCVAANTTACGDCIVNHLVANDDGPIRFVPAPTVSRDVERAVELFAGAGLLDDEPEFVEFAVFESGGVPQPA